MGDSDRVMMSKIPYFWQVKFGCLQNFFEPNLFIWCKIQDRNHHLSRSVSIKSKFVFSLPCQYLPVHCLVLDNTLLLFTQDIDTSRKLREMVQAGAELCQAWIILRIFMAARQQVQYPACSLLHYDLYRTEYSTWRKHKLFCNVQGQHRYFARTKIGLYIQMTSKGRWFQFKDDIGAMTSISGNRIWCVCVYETPL